MKHISKYFKIFLTIVILMGLHGNTKAQVNGFTLTDPSSPANHSLNAVFPLNVSFNWISTTTSATVTINYNAAMVSYDPFCSASLPACIVVSNAPGQLTITMSSLSGCTNTNAFSFNVCFKFNCPDSCTGVQKQALFTGTITDNLATTQTSTCTANGILNNNFSLAHTFYSYNAMTAEITYRVCFNNPDCFKINNPSFTISPPASGTITSAYGAIYAYSVAGNVITPNTVVFNQNAHDCFYYVVTLPCNTTGVQTSSVTLNGNNCNIPNSAIAGPIPVTYTLPSVAAAIPSISTQVNSTATYFHYNVFNNGNTPLNLTVANFLPQVHLKNSPNSVSQNTTQAGLICGIKYYDCTLSSGVVNALNGNSATDANAPTSNTTRFDHTINNLLPGKSVSLYLYYDLTSSCSGVAGNPPYKDSLAISYNCFAPPTACITCGNGNGGTANPVIIYNPQPNITCSTYQYVPGCKNIGDTVSVCYEFINNGDATLSGAVFKAALPAWLQAINSSVTYTGFSSNPTIVAGSNLKFNLPDITVGTNTYKICFKAVIQNGAIGGPNSFWTKVSGGNLINEHLVCYTTFNICAFAAIGIDKKVQGNLDAGFANSGTGNPNSPVTYEITLRNTGTIAIDNLVVIDRIPAPGNLTILGSPNSTLVNSQFTMQMISAPASSDYSALYSSTQNICTGWPATGINCNTGTWGTALGNVVKITFNPTFSLAPGQTYVFTFQAKIPAGTSAGLTACNTAGFIANATTGGYIINPVESSPVCVEVIVPPMSYSGCCKELLKKINETHTIDNDVLYVNLDLSAGPVKLKKVTVSLVQFEVKHPKDCDICVKDPKYFGNIIPGNSSLTWNTVPQDVPFTHMLQWQDELGKDWSDGYHLGLTVPLPPRSPIACCCDTINYCLRYTFMDENCVMCDTTICYTVYNGKDCKDNGNTGGVGNETECTCGFSPKFSYKGGSQTVTKDGGTLSLNASKFPVNVDPNFSCKDQNGKDCKMGDMVVTMKEPGSIIEQTLAGPSYAYTFLSAGTYIYSFTASCGGKKCLFHFNIMVY